MMGLEKMTPALNMAIFGIYVKFLGCTIFVLIVFFFESWNNNSKNPWPHHLLQFPKGVPGTEHEKKAKCYRVC